MNGKKEIYAYHAPTFCNPNQNDVSHTREIADLKNAGLNPILSSKNAGAPTGAGAMAQTPDFSKSYGSAVSNALMIAQTRKTNAEATIVEDHQNQAKLESELYILSCSVIMSFDV
jgi:hypothetical protein